MEFSNLVKTISQTHTALQQQMVKAINRSLTIRNWLIGFYIVEFEQKGEDRAKYGSGLLTELAKRVNEKSLSESNLKVCRLFYLVYPQLYGAIASQLEETGIALPIHQLSDDELKINDMGIRQSVIVELQITDNHPIGIRQTLSDEFSNRLIDRLSYTHLVQLLPITDPVNYKTDALSLSCGHSLRSCEFSH
jgi:hypothetical protein